MSVLRLDKANPQREPGKLSEIKSNSLAIRKKGLFKKLANEGPVAPLL